MDDRDLLYFTVVYEEKSLNKAACKLPISSQGLHRIIANLEHELDTALFLRTPKGVIPTESGDFLYAAAATILQQLRDLKNGIRQITGKNSRLRIVCANGVLNALSFDVILSFMEAHPAASVEWNECSNREAGARVMGFEADLGLLVGGLDGEQIVQSCLTQRRAAALVHKSHPLYASASLSVADLKKEKIIILNKDHYINGEFRRKCHDMGFTPHIIAETADSHFLYKLCRLPLGIGILLDFSADHFDMSDLKILRLREKFSWDIYSVIHRRNSALPLVKAFQAHLEQFREKFA